jgi:hypothetical protein
LGTAEPTAAKKVRPRFARLGGLSYACGVDSPDTFGTDGGFVMGSIPLPVLVGAFAAVAIGIAYFVWVRLSRKAPEQQKQ